jgi:hypothetical protein
MFLNFLIRKSIAFSNSDSAAKQSAFILVDIK